MWKLFVFSFISSVLSTPLQQNSLITLRTVLAPKATGGGNTAPPPPYGPLVLEEWGSSGLVPLQSWSLPCTLPGLSTDVWTEGRLSPRYPWGDQVWFLCRNVAVNSSLSTNPAPVVYNYLNENGELGTWAEEALYPNGTNLINIVPYWDETQNLNIFYLLGGGTVAAGPASPAKPAQARIRVDSGPGLPPDAQGALLASQSGVTINQLRILNKTLYGPGIFGGSTGIPSPTIFQIGAEGFLPTGTRNQMTQIQNFPLVLSVWTDPFSEVWWRTGFNRTAYVARHDNSDGSDLVFSAPPSGWSLGSVSWSLATARQEGTDFTVYLTNTSHIVKNTLNGLQNGLPYQPVVQAPPGWRYLSAHARAPNIPTPSASATATSSASASATATASASATSTSTSTSSSSSSSTSTPTPTAEPSATSSASPSASTSSYPSSTPTATRNPNVSSDPSPSHSPSSSPSVSITPTSTASNGTIPLPANNNQAPSDALTPGDQAGIGLGSIAAVCIAGLAMIHFSPTIKNLWTRQFGSSVKTVNKGVSFRNPVSTDVPITINHNPQALVQHRLEQLKDLQKQISLRETTTPQAPDIDRTKKQFGQVIAGDFV